MWSAIVHGDELQSSLHHVEYRFRAGRVEQHTSITDWQSVRECAHRIAEPQAIHVRHGGHGRVPDNLDQPNGMVAEGTLPIPSMVILMVPSNLIV